MFQAPKDDFSITKSKLDWHLSCVKQHNQQTGHITYQENWTELQKHLKLDDNIGKNANKSKPLTYKRSKRARTTFTPVQLAELEKEFDQEKYLNSNRVKDLATRLSLGTLQIKVWFKNRRRKNKIKEEKQNNVSYSVECPYIENDSKMLLTNLQLDSSNIHNQPQQKFIPDLEIPSLNYFDTNNNDEMRQIQITEMTNNECNQNNKLLSIAADDIVKHEIDQTYNNFLDAWNEYSSDHLNEVGIEKSDCSTEINVQNKNFQYETFYSYHMDNSVNYQNYILNGMNTDYHQAYFTNNFPSINVE